MQRHINDKAKDSKSYLLIRLLIIFEHLMYSMERLIYDNCQLIILFLLYFCKLHVLGQLPNYSMRYNSSIAFTHRIDTVSNYG